MSEQDTEQRPQQVTGSGLRGQPEPTAVLAAARAQREADRIMAADADAEDDPTEAIRAAAAGTPLTDGQTVDALDWFLSEDQGEFTKAIRLNVGGPADEDGKTLNPANPPKWVDWVVRPLDLDTIKTIRRQSQAGGNRRQRRTQQAGGEIDDTQFNLGVVVQASVSPNLVEAAQSLGMADPRMALKLRFQNKSGLIGQIVAEVLDLSGYNENDVRDAAEGGSVEVRAAGNS
jgi:hypothetical protein